MSKTTSVLSTLGSWLQVITSNVGTLVILIILGHFLIGGVWELKQSLTGIRRYDPRLQLSPYHAMSDADKWTFATEFTEARKHMHFVPYSLWRLDPFKGRFVNINPDGTRKTIKSPTPNAQKVFLLGGSTMWGEGATDQGTIASHLQAMLGNQYDVTNYGEVAYNSAQELNVLLERLAKGDIPKVVVFYDGVNDGFASVYSPAVPRAIHSNFQSAFHPGQPPMAQRIIDLVKQSGWGRLQDIWQQVAQKLHLPDHNKNTWDAQIAPKVDANIAEDPAGLRRRDYPGTSTQQGVRL
jgi:hypothetical protein